MDYRSLHMKTVADLKQIAKDRGIKIPAGTKKAVLVEMILEKGRAAEADAEPRIAAAAETKQEVKPEMEAGSQTEAEPGGEQNADQQPLAVAEEEGQAVPEPDVRVEAGETQAARSESGAAVRQGDGRHAQQRGTKAPAKPRKPQPRRGAAPQSRKAADKAAAKAEESARSTEEAPSGDGAAHADLPREKAATRAAEASPMQAAYPRPMSTQQRMGARSHPVQGARLQPRGAVAAGGRAGGRFNAEPAQARMNRGSEGGQAARRAGAGEGASRQSGRRIPGEPVEAPQTASVPAAAQQSAQPASAVQEKGAQPALPAQNAFVGGDFADGDGILEIHPEGYGFLRAENYLPGNRDVYVSATQIRRFNLRTGDYVEGKTRPQQMGDRSVGLVYINRVNGQEPDAARTRKPFDSLIPVYPDSRLNLEREGDNDLSMRLVDMLAPIGKGQRGMIVSPPKAGKTTLLKKIANAITANHPEVHLIVLLIDERPEEVTDMKRSIQGEVVYSTFDEAPENHTRVSEMVLERAQRLVEMGKDVVILLDSITRLARAYNLVIPPTGRSLSGGLDPGALFRPKRFFGAARNIENGGSLTIIATALVDTGSRMDDIIFEEFKGTGNMELHLDRSLSDRRIFPAIDLYRSGTRREELLLSPEELEGVYQVRRVLSKGSPQEAAEQLISLMEKTKTNGEFFQKLKAWLNVCEKDGFTMGR